MKPKHWDRRMPTHLEEELCAMAEKMKNTG